MIAYEEFIEKKALSTPRTGFAVTDADLHDSNLPHQRDIIKWAADGGRRAIFASFGLGKTQIQLELAKICLQKHEGLALIICPLGVKQEFKKDAERLGISITYVRNNEEVEKCPTRIMITNYERVRDGNIDVTQFIFASLDEASVLRSYGSKTYQTFLSLFGTIPFRYVCTATPSPNKYKELIHYAGFLGIMDTGQALTRFFKRDSTQANNLTIHPHKEREFWLWMASWAIFITKPSDLSYSDEGYDLPPLQIHWHLIDLQIPEAIKDRDGQTKMFRNEASSLSEAAKEKRDSLIERLAKVKSIIANADSNKHWLIWHHLENERYALEKCEISGLKTVFGNQPDDLKEKLLIEFSEGQYRVLATKPEIAGQGCNFQGYCSDAIFMGINDKFNDFIQAIHRIQRFQQPKPCSIHIIYTDSEENIRKNLESKWKRHYELVDEMTGIIKEYGLANAGSISELKRSMTVERKEVKGKNFTCVNNDNVQEMKLLSDNSKHMILTSIPFSNHYEYTPSYLDFGHTNGDDHFFQQMDFLTPECFRVLMPGRIAAIHVKDRIMFGNVTGYGMPTVNPFHAKSIFHYMKHGFLYMGMIEIETDVVRENNSTYRLGWSEQCKDGSKMGVGSPEYVLIFRKPQTDTSKAYADVPVVKSKQIYSRGRWQIDARAKWNSSGNRLLTSEEIQQLPIDKISGRFYDFYKDHVYDYKTHVEIAEQLEAQNKLPATFETLKVPARSEWVWDDIVRMRTLNSSQNQRNQEQHICPFQLDVVERLINRYTNEGEEIMDPFAGLMSVPFCAINMNRKGYGIELNTTSFIDGVRYCKEAEFKRSVPTLFDLVNEAV